MKTITSFFFQLPFIALAILLFTNYRDSLSQNVIWAKQMGGISDDIGNTIVADGTGNVYTTGSFAGTADFDPGEGVYNLSAVGQQDIFITKLDASGNLVWAKQIGGFSDDVSYSMAVDACGYVYITGSFAGMADFNPDAGVFNLTSAGLQDIFIAKFNASGNFIWAKRIGESSVNIGTSIALDNSGYIYTTGVFWDKADFDPGVGTNYLTSAGTQDIFIAKFDTAGNFLWARQMGGASDDVIYSMALDGSGNLFTTGSFQDVVDFDPGDDAFNLTSYGNRDVFVSKLDNLGNLIWIKQIGGDASDEGVSLAVDMHGNVYVTGGFYGTVDFDPGPQIFNLSSVGFQDIFILKLDADADFIWAKQIGGASSSGSCSIIVDFFSNVYTTGFFAGTISFDSEISTPKLTSEGGMDIYISKIDGSGNLEWIKQIGGASDDGGNSLTMDGFGNIYAIAGGQETINFTGEKNSFNISSVGYSDVLIMKLSQSAPSLSNQIDTACNNNILFPNPSSGNFMVKHSLGTDAIFKMFDMLGKEVKCSVVKSADRFEVETTAAAGIYIVSLQKESLKVIKRLEIY